MIEERKCEECGEALDPYARIDAIFCSDSCRVKNYKATTKKQQYENESHKEAVTDEDINEIHEHLYDIEKELKEIRQDSYKILHSINNLPTRIYRR